MSYNYQNLSLLDARALMLYASQLELKIANTFGVYSGGNKLLFFREDRTSDEYPYISATPTQYITGGQVSQSRYIATDIIGKELTMTHTNVNLPDFVDFAFSLESYAMKDTDNGISIEFEKNDGSEFTVASVQYIIANQTAFRLFGKKTDGTVEVINAGYFDRYTTNTQTGNRWYSDRPNNIFTETVSITSILGYSSSQIFEGCAPILKTNCRVFKNDEYAKDYLLTGALNGLLEEEEEPEEPEEELTSTVLYYYDTMETYEDLGMTKLLNTYHKQIVVRGEEMPLIHERDLVTYSVNANGSVDFHVKNGCDQYLTNVKINGNVEYGINDNLPHNLTYYITHFDTCGFGMYYDSINGYYVKNTIRTNMRGVGANGELMPPESIGLEGDEMLSNSNSADYDVGLSECWLLSKESVQSLGKKFNTTVDRSQDNSSAYVVGDWILGLSAYANPLDVVCDLFYLPVDVGDFVDSTLDSFTFSPIE